DPAGSGNITDHENLQIDVSTVYDGTSRIDGYVALNVSRDLSRERSGEGRAHQAQVQRQDIAPRASSLGRLKDRATVATDDDLRAVRERDVLAHVEEIEVSADINACAGVQGDALK